MGGPFNNVGFGSFKDSASTYFNNAETEPDCIKNGFKALLLLYYGHNDDWSHDDINESISILQEASIIYYLSIR